MGIHLDTLEDNDESAGWKVQKIKQNLGILPLPSRKFPSIECPTCSKFFFAEVELNNHIFDEHRHDYEVNGRIVREGTDLNYDKIAQLQLTDIENQIVSLQARIEENDRSIDDEWAKYQVTLHSSMREEYLFGFLEYLRAHDLEVNRQSTDSDAFSRHFETAYGKLRPFSTSMAQQVRRAIAFKMNWFEEHTEVPASSLFFLAWHFFTYTYEDVTKINNLPIISKRQKQGVILDEFHSELLDAIQLYYSDRSTLNDHWMYKLEKLINGISNRNYLDKLALFKARIYRDWQNVDTAKKAYFHIRTHPKFGAEARAFNE